MDYFVSQVENLAKTASYVPCVTSHPPSLTHSRTSLSELTVYDIKVCPLLITYMNVSLIWRGQSAVKKVTNQLMNLSPMETTVREATNDDAWCGFYSYEGAVVLIHWTRWVGVRVRL